jgi:Uma2 family endonuclease
MSLIETATDIEYPESDGLPMGETDLHRDWMIRLLDMLQYRYRGQRVYVASDLLVYYEEGEPTRYVVPDEFVVLDCDPGRRRTFKIWEEGKVPNVVIEVTSKGTRNEDTKHKPKRYADIGIQEYFLYDPTSDYLTPPLRGFRLEDNGHVPIEPDESQALECRQLGLLLRLEDGELVLQDAETGERLLTESEAEQRAREAEQRAREAAEARAEAAEQELARLRELLKRQGGED